MASKLGSALLDDNNHLRTYNNEFLTNLASLEVAEEDSKNEEERYMFRIESLHEELEDLKEQLTKEKKIYVEVQNISEEHDKKQTDLISDYSKKT